MARKKKKTKKTTRRKKSKSKSPPKKTPPPRPTPPPPATPPPKQEPPKNVIESPAPKVTVEYLPSAQPQQPPPIMINKTRQTTPFTPRCQPCGMKAAPRPTCPQPQPRCNCQAMPPPFMPLTPLLIQQPQLQRVPSVQVIQPPVDNKPIINVIVNKDSDDDDDCDPRCPGRRDYSTSSSIVETMLSSRSDMGEGRIRYLTQRIMGASQDANMARMRLQACGPPSIRRVQSAQGRIWNLLDLETQLADELNRYRRSGRIRDPAFLNNLEQTEQRLRQLVQSERMAATRMSLPYGEAKPCGGLFDQLASVVRFFTGGNATTLYHYPAGAGAMRITTETPTPTTTTPTTTTTQPTSTAPKKTPTKKKKKKKKKSKKKKKKRKKKRRKKKKKK